MKLIIAAREERERQAFGYLIIFFLLILQCDVRNDSQFTGRGSVYDPSSAPR